MPVSMKTKARPRKANPLTEGIQILLHQQKEKQFSIYSWWRLAVAVGTLLFPLTGLAETLDFA
jgi:hypothetical protein